MGHDGGNKFDSAALAHPPSFNKLVVPQYDMLRDEARLVAMHVAAARVAEVHQGHTARLDEIAREIEVLRDTVQKGTYGYVGRIKPGGETAPTSQLTEPVREAISHRTSSPNYIKTPAQQVADTCAEVCDLPADVREQCVLYALMQLTGKAYEVLPREIAEYLRVRHLQSGALSNVMVEIRAGESLSLEEIFVAAFKIHMQVRGWYVGNEPVPTNSFELQERLLDYERSSFGRMLDDFRKGLNARGSRLEEADMVAATEQSKQRAQENIRQRDLVAIEEERNRWHRMLRHELQRIVYANSRNTLAAVAQPELQRLLSDIDIDQVLAEILGKSAVVNRMHKPYQRAVEIARQNLKTLQDLYEQIKGSEVDEKGKVEMLGRSARMLARVERLLSADDTISQQELARDTKETDETMYEEIKEYVGRINAVMQDKLKLNSWVEVHVGGAESVSVQLQRNLDALLPNETQTAGEGEVDYIHFLKQIIAEVASLEAKLSPEFVQTRKEVSE